MKTFIELACIFQIGDVMGVNGDVMGVIGDVMGVCLCTLCNHIF